MGAFLKGFTAGASAAITSVVALGFLVWVIFGEEDEEDENDLHHRLAAIR